MHISKEKVEDTKRIKNLRKYIAASTIIMLTFIAVRRPIASGCGEVPVARPAICLYKVRNMDHNA